MAYQADTTKLTDKSLVKIIHTETHRGYKISVMISRFGGLDVLVLDSADHCVFQGFNIISARIWVEKNIMNGKIDDLSPPVEQLAVTA